VAGPVGDPLAAVEGGTPGYLEPRRVSTPIAGFGFGTTAQATASPERIATSSVPDARSRQRVGVKR
jgi:hypothetical protein